MSDGPLVHPLIDYPTTYTFKIVGRTGGAFPDFVRGLVSRALGRILSTGQMRVRESARGNYQSVTLDVPLQTELERRAIYHALWDSERVVFYL